MQLGAIFEIFWIFIKGRGNDIFQIFEWIIKSNLPLIETEDLLTRDIMKTPKISTKTLREYTLATRPLLEEATMNNMPEKISL